MSLNFSHSKADKHSTCITPLFPSSIHDLCIHRKKLDQIMSFFNSTYRSHPILLLTGPSGSAKSTSIKIVSRHLGWSCIEWENVEAVEDGNYIGIFSQFETFITSAFRSKQQNVFLLVEEYPFVLENSVMKSKFYRLQAQLIRYLQVGADALPVVFIRSDNCAGGKDYLDLFSKSFRNCPFVEHVAFNEIAPTFLKKALKGYISASYSNTTGQVKVLSKYIDKIVEVCSGDIRYGINILKLLAICTASAQPFPSISLYQLSRDCSIELFHALGKIFMKRKDFCIFDYTEVTATSVSTLNLYLEHNCFDYYEEIEPICEFIDLLSVSESFTPSYNSITPCMLQYLGAYYLKNACQYKVKVPHKMFYKPDWFGLIQGKSAENNSHV